MKLQKTANCLETVADYVFKVTDTMLMVTQFMPGKIISNIINLVAYCGYLHAYLLYLTALGLTFHNNNSLLEKKEQLQLKFHTYSTIPTIICGIIATCLGITAILTNPHIALILAVIAESLFLLEDLSLLLIAFYNVTKDKQNIASIVIGVASTYLSLFSAVNASITLAALSLGTAFTIAFTYVFPGVGIAILGAAIIAYLVLAYYKDNKNNKNKNEETSIGLAAPTGEAPHDQPAVVFSTDLTHYYAVTAQHSSACKPTA